MKIAMVSPRILDGGGIEEHILQISRVLCKRGHKVRIISSDYSESGASLILRRFGNIKNLRVYTLPSSLSGLIHEYPEISGLAVNLAKLNPDIIHVHHFNYQVNTEALIAARFLGVPFFYTPHFHPWWSYNEAWKSRVWKATQFTVHKMLLEEADRVFAVSEQEKKILIQEGKIPKAKVVVAPNGIDVNSLKKETSWRSLKAKFAIPKDKKYVLLLGRLTTERKGAKLGIEIFKRVATQVPEAHLILAGYYDDKTYKELTELASKYDLLNKISIVGFLSNIEKATLVSHSYVFLAPTSYEAFGITFAEALYKKTPVVATNIGGIPYVVRNRVDGYLVTGRNNFDDFAKYTVRLLKNDELRKTMGLSGHKRVLRKFHWDLTAKIIETRYRTILYRKLHYRNKEVVTGRKLVASGQIPEGLKKDNFKTIVGKE
jgi:glycosyltransferase involved in cell wall biosynthesis